MIYVASSGRNTFHETVVENLRAAGLPVYNFKEPTTCFKWTDVVEHNTYLSPQQYLDALNHPKAQAGFAQDMKALMAATTVVMVTPCGNSAHLEAGYAIGRGKRVSIYYPPIINDIDLMHSMFSNHFASITALTQWCQASELKALGQGVN